VKFSKTVGSTAFKLEQLNSDAPLGGFVCPVEEYNVYLYEEAIGSQNNQYAKRPVPVEPRRTLQQKFSLSTTVPSPSHPGSAPERRDAWAALEYAKDEGREEARSELGKVIEEKDQKIEELRRKLREAGID
jgi:hypothetical protein